ncbi:MAG: tripartite tricarboxylate transporter substrate-binding protein [Hyphomicrobiales bacterium]|nr:tripartite tricarboxylate transporter substrate-binding protein [Hyphomicrobiales bacterium]
MISRTTFIRGLAALAVAGATFTPATAADVAETYKGKTLTILLGHPPGGSYDLYAQLAAAHMGQYIPGEPNIIVQHMPGGGGSKGAAYFFSKVEADGMTIALLPDTLAHIQLLDPKRGKWDASKIEYIGRFAPANAAFAIRKDAPATSIEEMKTKETVVGCTGKSARSAQMPAMLKNLAGLNMRLICGYKGSSAATLATLRGEVDMTSKNWAAFKSGDAAELEAGNLKIVLQAGLERDPDLPDVPLMQEIVDDPMARKVMEFVSAGAPIGRSLMALSGTPPEIVAALRKAFQDMVADPAFLADAAKRNAIINPASGEAVAAVNKGIFETPPEVIEAAVKAMDTSDAGELKN